MFYVTDTTTELYTWQPKLNGEAMCAASFLEEVANGRIYQKRQLEATVISMNLRPLKQEQVVS